MNNCHDGRTVKATRTEKDPNRTVTGLNWPDTDLDWPGSELVLPSSALELPGSEVETIWMEPDQTELETQQDGTVTAYLRGNPPLKEGEMLHGRYIVNKQRDLHRGWSYSRMYLCWDTVCQRSVEIQELNVWDDRNERDIFLWQIDAFAESSYEGSVGLFRQMAESPASWCGVEGVERIFESFEENGTWYIVREYLEGKMLGYHLRNRRLSKHGAEGLMNALMDTVTRLHDRGIIHKGLDPNTIMIVKGRPILSDFGYLDLELEILNNPTHYSEALPEEFYSNYTPKYCYNEISNTFGPNRRWIDIYSLCALYYTFVTGKKPWWGETDWDSVPGLSPGRRTALKKGMCAGNRTWYASVWDFRREFMR